MTRVYIISIVSAYLLGSIPFGYILVRLFRGDDIRETGSGNIGATNVARSGSKGLAIATLLLDASKGFLAVHVALHVGLALSPPNSEAAIYVAVSLAALFSIIGHMFPVWLRFRGGKGVATGVGAFIGLAPWAVLIAVAIFAALVLLSRYVSLGSVVAAVSFPVIVFLLYRTDAQHAMLPAIIVASALIVARHKENIRRLLAGTEHRFGSPAGSKAR